MKAGTKRAAEVAKVTAPPLDEICTARVAPVTAFAVGATTKAAPPTRVPPPFASEPRLAAAVLPCASFRGSHRSRQEPLEGCSCVAVAVLEAVAEGETEAVAEGVGEAVAESDAVGVIVDEDVAVALALPVDGIVSTKGMVVHMVFGSGPEFHKVLREAPSSRTVTP